MQFTCPQCGKKLKAPPEMAGRMAQCTRCQTPIVVPAMPVSPGVIPQATSLPVSSASAVAAGSHSLASDDEPLIRFPRPHAESQADIDLTPMIDVVFQLLIFFMVTAAFGLQKSLDLPPRRAEEESQSAQTVEELEQDDSYVIVRVEKDSTLWVNESEATSEPDLFAKLREARRGTGNSGMAHHLLVVAHGDASHEKVVLALDAGSTVGMESVKLATVDD